MTPAAKPPTFQHWKVPELIDAAHVQNDAVWEQAEAAFRGMANAGRRARMAEAEASSEDARKEAKKQANAAMWKLVADTFLTQDGTWMPSTPGPDPVVSAIVAVLVERMPAETVATLQGELRKLVGAP